MPPRKSAPLYVGQIQAPFTAIPTIPYSNAFVSLAAGESFGAGLGGAEKQEDEEEGGEEGSTQNSGHPSNSMSKQTPL